jgi:hypothetical protein
MGFAEGAQSALDQRRVGQTPTVEGGVVHRQAALPEQLLEVLEVTVAQRVAQILGDGLQDQRRFVVATLEVVLGPVLGPLDEGVQDHGPPPELEAHMQPASSTQGKHQNFATGPSQSVSVAPRGRRPVTIRILASGRLHGDPVQRTSKAGNPSTVAKMIADQGDSGIWISVGLSDSLQMAVAVAG